MIDARHLRLVVIRAVAPERCCLRCRKGHACTGLTCPRHGAVI